jgi:hypothetical protein
MVMSIYIVSSVEKLYPLTFYTIISQEQKKPNVHDSLPVRHV